MRKYIHTALVMLAFPCFGQFTDIWTNLDYFAVDQMASQCYSASVERCVAVGVTPDAPSWWDYILGKNYAKLSSVKANIKAVRPYFVNSLTNALDLLKARDSAAWTSNPHFLLDCSLPTNALDETPYFKSQYPNVTGGWYHAWIMLTNMTVSEDPGKWFVIETNGYVYFGANVFDVYPWAAATNEAESNWAGDAVTFGYGGPFSWAVGFAYNSYDYPSNYVADLKTESMFIGYDVSTQAVSRSASLYHLATPVTNMTTLANDDPYAVLEESTFDSQGSSVTNGWYLVGTSPATNAADVQCLLVGKESDSDTDPGIPAWCNEPSLPAYGPEPNDYNIRTRGFYTEGQRAILNWAVTNGFKFR